MKIQFDVFAQGLLAQGLALSARFGIPSRKNVIPKSTLTVTRVLAVEHVFLVSQSNLFNEHVTFTFTTAASQHHAPKPNVQSQTRRKIAGNK